MRANVDLEITEQGLPFQELYSSTTLFWSQWKAEGLVWRNREFPEVADYTFPSLTPLAEPERLQTRGLFLAIGNPRPWDKILMSLRLFFGG